MNKVNLLLLLSFLLLLVGSSVKCEESLDEDVKKIQMNF